MKYVAHVCVKKPMRIAPIIGIDRDIKKIGVFNTIIVSAIFNNLGGFFPILRNIANENILNTMNDMIARISFSQI